MEEVFAKAEELITDVRKYIDNRVSVAKLNVAEKVSQVLSGIIAIVVVAVMFVFFLVFAGVALACAIASWTGEYYWGFLIVSGMYLLIALFISMAKERIIRLPILNALLNQLFKNDEED